MQSDDDCFVHLGVCVAAGEMSSTSASVSLTVEDSTGLAIDHLRKYTAEVRQAGYHVTTSRASTAVVLNEAGEANADESLKKFASDFPELITRATHDTVVVYMAELQENTPSITTSESLVEIAYKNKKPYQYSVKVTYYI